MNVQCYELHGTRVAQLASIGDALRTDKQAIEIISAASACQPELIIIPVERLSEDFLNLKTRVAGEVLQKFVTYQKRVVILGDISTRLNESSSLRDLIYECNAGREIWFVATYRNLIKGYGRKRSSPDFRLKPRSHRAQRMQPVELARHKAKKVLG